MISYQLQLSRQNKNTAVYFTLFDVIDYLCESYVDRKSFEMVFSVYI